MADLDLLVDGDLLLYRCACGVETEIKWDEENHLLYSNFDDAWGLVRAQLEALDEKFRPLNVVIALSSTNNFRKKLSESYKANRAGNRKPLCFADLKEKLRISCKTVEFDGLEADDVLGILATKPSNRRSIIVSDDKDFASIPATVYAKGEITTYSEKEADYNHLYQTLVGDQADNYPGCPGIGPVKAKTALDKEATWATVLALFEKQGLTEEDALLQARLARILRWSDWDSEKKEPILWTP
jgi:DNA polymerase-1